jgi:hypothetical protein
LGICVPKAENLAIMSKHTSKPRHGDAQAEKTAPHPEESEAAGADRPDKTPPPIEMARRDAAPPPDKPAPEQTEAPSSPFGSLFVGAFRSAVTTGLSAFK